MIYIILIKFSNMNILSLFDWISCGQRALSNLWIKIDNYYSSEIEKSAMSITRYNFPNTIFLWDVKNIDKHYIDYETWKKINIDILIGWSPCTSFSFAWKRNGMTTMDNVEILSLAQYLKLKEEGFEFKWQSYLFWEYIRLLKEIKPKYFFLENVKMDKKWENLISETLWVKWIHINSADFSWQERKRIYWTNLPFDENIPKCETTVEDILEDEVDEKYVIIPQKSVQILDEEFKKRKIGFIWTDWQANRIYNIHWKSVTLLGEAWGGGAKTWLYALPCITPDRVVKRQLWRRFKPPKSKSFTLTTMDKHGILTNSFIRKLTPLECERLQTTGDDFTKYWKDEKWDIIEISDNKRYKALWNWWTVKVIEHFFKSLK